MNQMNNKETRREEESKREESLLERAGELGHDAGELTSRTIQGGAGLLGELTKALDGLAKSLANAGSRGAEHGNYAAKDKDPDKR